MWVERLDDDGKWHLVPEAKVYGRRDYGVFAWLAGVREDAPKPIAEPRGYPIPISEELLDHFARCRAPDWEEYADASSLDFYHDRDSHTPHWYLASELDAAVKRGLPDLLPGRSWDYPGGILDLIPYWCSLADSSDRVRIVFNFDN
jgi:hypothetical protein